jgi:hypothetical protein
MNAKINGNNSVQQKDINWSYLIRGKLARTHININTMIQVLNPKTTPDIKPSKNEPYRP